MNEKAQAEPLLRALALVALGGAAGSLTRYGVGLALPLAPDLSLLAVNLVGALALGAIVSWSAGRRPRLQLLLGAGFCGGFTSYSALTAGLAAWLLGGTPLVAIGLAAASVFGGVLATLAGVWIGNRLRPRASSFGPSAEREDHS